MTGRAQLPYEISEVTGNLSALSSKSAIRTGQNAMEKAEQLMGRRNGRGDQPVLVWDAYNWSPSRYEGLDGTSDSG